VIGPEQPLSFRQGRATMERRTGEPGHDKKEARLELLRTLGAAEGFDL
jgi:hypothetical protein